MSLAGVGRRDLAFSDGHGLFGFGPPGGAGINAPEGSHEHDVLQVRALYLESGSGAERRRLLLVAVDIAYGSRVLHAALHRALAAAGIELHPGELLIAGTHTHSAPGHVAGNLYDHFGQWPPGFRTRVAAEVVRKAAEAAREAIHGAVPCEVGVGRANLWRLGRNRSLRPFLHNFDGDLSRWHGRFAAPPGLTPEELAIDPRLTVIAFVAAESRRLLASWVTWCCHPATLGPASGAAPWSSARYLHRDWVGVAVDEIERRAGGLAIALQGANGDVTPLPSGVARLERPLARVNEIGLGVAETSVAAIEEALRSTAPLDLEIAFERFSPAESGLPEFEIGLPVVLGSEEASRGYAVRLLGEARTFRWHPNARQRPKLPALGLVQLGLKPFVRPSPEHPLWLVRLGDHLVFASPFEQTTVAAWQIEQALVDRWRAVRGADVTASPLGLVADYAGYLTTPEEYQLQHYEGAHTLYGHGQLAALRERWVSLVAPRLSLSHAPPRDEAELARKVAAVLTMPARDR